MEVKIEMEEKIRKLVSYFKGNDYVSEKNLLRHNEMECIKEATEKGYIKEYRKNDIGDQLYVITEKGKEFLV